PGRRKYACRECAHQLPPLGVAMAADKLCPSTWPPNRLRKPRAWLGPRKRLTPMASSFSRDSNSCNTSLMVTSFATETRKARTIRIIRRGTLAEMTFTAATTYLTARSDRLKDAQPGAETAAIRIIPAHFSVPGRPVHAAA